MWLATLMGSDIIKEADDKKLIKKFICNPGLRGVMKGGEEDPQGTKAEVDNICGPPVSGDDSVSDSKDGEKTSLLSVVAAKNAAKKLKGPPNFPTRELTGQTTTS